MLQRGAGSTWESIGFKDLLDMLRDLDRVLPAPYLPLVPLQASRRPQQQHLAQHPPGLRGLLAARRAVAPYSHPLATATLAAVEARGSPRLLRPPAEPWLLLLRKRTLQRSPAACRQPRFPAHSAPAAACP
jgi:hypothetical protein